MRAQSIRFGTEVVSETVSRVNLSKRPFEYWTEYNEEEPANTADTLIIATGASARRLNLPGEEKYWQRGISACAVCDGAVPIFRNKPLVVIGGGDSAAEEAIFLTKYGKNVTVLVRRDKLRASKTMATRLLTHPKVTVKFNTVAVEARGGDKNFMTHLQLKNVESGEETEMDANGLFYAVGHDPATQLVRDQIDMDEDGYILTKPGTSYTSIEGVFAAGDVQDKRYRQAITSAGKLPCVSSPDTRPLVGVFLARFMHTTSQIYMLTPGPHQQGSGCIAALEAERYLAEKDASIETELEAAKEVKKAEPNGNVPEYKSNPLL